MTTLLCIIAVALAALSLLVSIAGLIFAVKLGKGISISVALTQPEPKAPPDYQELIARAVAAQAEVDKIVLESSKQNRSLEKFVEDLNELMGGTANG